ncbi:hypothetical protein EW146_g8124 [Bondarzewia mesenterica]|uniref:GED domain-containing protein n=1 Tax=Bondarzewia mesenterica TaxID=1095465 RepID=A0A4S4LH73_9AGAM|nr:hypothetical protein EW146_g8124 [Bondarzewia mesenterica]
MGSHQSDSSGFESASEDHAVGLSDPRFSDHRRRMLDLMNKLRGTGAQLDVDLPIIAVIGSQSAGKSSLIESISGISLPRASGTCTRCPTECRLFYSDEPWRCIVSLRFITDEHGVPLDKVRDERFGEPLFSKVDVTERIRRAQRAILNPGVPSIEFISALDEDLQDNQLTFSSNYVCLEIRGRDVTDLTFVDLPGLIATHGPGGRESDVGLIENLATDHINKPSCIILLAVACETDFQNQKASRLAGEHDTQGTRTIGVSGIDALAKTTNAFSLSLEGVLTKPDRISPGEEDDWLKYIRGEEDQTVQWYCVKNPNSQALATGITWEGARAQERDFFFEYEPLVQPRMDVPTASRLPQLQDEIDKLLTQTEDSIGRLPQPPSSEPVAEILRMVGGFVRAVERHIEGTPHVGGLLQSIRPAQDTFQKAIRRTAPDFKPFERDTGHYLMPSPGFLAHEEDYWMVLSQERNEPIYIDEVMEKAKTAVTRELPNNIPFIVTKQIIASIVKQWMAPSRQLFEQTNKTLNNHIMRLVEEHFGQFAQGGLKQCISGIVTKHLRACSETAVQRIMLLLEAEMEPFTRNNHYLNDYRAKFLAYYKGVRQANQNNDFIRNLEGTGPGSTSETFQQAMTKTLSGFTEMGLHGIQPVALAKVLPEDPMEAGIEIMADVRAYFQGAFPIAAENNALVIIASTVAYKRFVDNIPMSIDQALIRGLAEGLEAAIFSGLGVSGPKGFENCQRLLQEPPGIVEKRNELQKRRDRLSLARQELLDVFTGYACDRWVLLLAQPDVLLTSSNIFNRLPQNEVKRAEIKKYMVNQDDPIGLIGAPLKIYRREELDLMNRLNSSGVQASGDIDLPVIAAIGSQSAGKSSLIESISGIKLPRAAGTCTRCPTECLLSHSEDAWKCEVKLRFDTDIRGIPLGQPLIVPFGGPISESNKADVEDRIRRAQQAILNPNREPEEFLDEQLPTDRELTFSSNFVSLEISGNQIPDLSFIDLPGNLLFIESLFIDLLLTRCAMKGLIQNVGTQGRSSDISMIKELVESYISRPSCIILLTMNCETDFATQGAHDLARKHDPKGTRTIGVLTKPDRIPERSEQLWLRYIRNDEEPLKNNWFCVKQPDAKELENGITWNDAREREDRFFRKTAPWDTLETEYRGLLSTRNLISKSMDVLSSMISKRIPKLSREIDDLISSTNKDLHELPKAPSTNCVSEIHDLIKRFAREVEVHIEGSPDLADGLLQQLNPKKKHFLKAILQTSPDFRPWEKASAKKDETRPFPGFLESEGVNVDLKPEQDSQTPRMPIFLDDVQERMNSSVTRGLPDSFSPLITKRYIVSFIEDWEQPIHSLVDGYYDITRRFVDEIIKQHFERFGRLHRCVQQAVDKRLKRCRDDALERTIWLLELEKTPQTENVHNYGGFKEKYGAYFRTLRQERLGKTALTELSRYGTNSPHAQTAEYKSAVDQSLKNLTKVGFHGLNHSDLAKLAPIDPMDPVLDIMTKVCAYFQGKSVVFFCIYLDRDSDRTLGIDLCIVAFKRFADYVPMAVDKELVQGLRKDLDRVLMDEIGFDKIDINERCQALLVEPPETTTARKNLETKLQRLNTAKKELSRFNLPYDDEDRAGDE